MFLLRWFSPKYVQDMVNNLFANMRFNFREYILFALLGFVAHYFGFMWALTHFDPFYADWRFFLDLSLGFSFVLLLGALMVEFALALFAAMAMISSYIYPDQTLRVSKWIRIKIPLLGVPVIAYVVIFIIFATTIMMAYTHMNAWQILASLSALPILLGVWSWFVIVTLKRHQIHELKFDLGERFEIRAENFGQMVEKFRYFETELVEEIGEFIPHDVKPYYDKVIAHLRGITQRLDAQIPTKEVVATEITELQKKLKNLQWRIHYARFAMPMLRSMLIGLFLFFCLSIGYTHVEQFTDSRRVELTLTNGEKHLATPMTHRTPWQVYFQNGELLMINDNELKSMRPAPRSK